MTTNNPDRTDYFSLNTLWQAFGHCVITRLVVRRAVDSILVYSAPNMVKRSRHQGSRPPNFTDIE